MDPRAARVLFLTMSTLSSRAMRDRALFSFNERLERFETRARQLVTGHFLREEMVVRRAFKSANRDHLIVDAINLRAQDEIDITIRSWQNEEEDEFVQALTALFRRTGELFAAVGTAQIAYTFPGFPEATSRWLETYVPQLVDELDATSLRGVTKAIRKGIELGETLPEITARVSDVYDGWIRSRPAVIARTEVGRIASRVQYEVITGSSIPMEELEKEWITAQDERVRTSHAELNGVKIPAKERFNNGLLYPRELGGVPEEVIQCRCVIAFSAKTMDHREIPVENL